MFTMVIKSTRLKDDFYIEQLHPSKGVGKGSRRREYTKWLRGLIKNAQVYAAVPDLKMYVTSIRKK